MNELDRMLAERACERLIYEYSRRIDFGEGAAIADLFTADAVWRGDIELRGQDRIRAWFTERAQLTRRVSRHLCTNVVIDVTGRGRGDRRVLPRQLPPRPRRARRDAAGPGGRAEVRGRAP